MIISRIEFCVDELSTSNISRVQILEKRGRRRSVGFYEYKGLTRFDISKSLKITHEGPGINGTFITDDKSLTELIQKKLLTKGLGMSTLTGVGPTRGHTKKDV